MKYYYDLHLHSCLSPCGDMDMTPNNLVNMAKLLELDVIALTDHNTVRNCAAAMAVGREIGLLVIPGMELTTSEDIHAVCLFPTLEQALAWDAYVDGHRIKVRNRAEIYGRQVIMNENDEEIGEIESLLIPATEISIMSAYETDYSGRSLAELPIMRGLKDIKDIDGIAAYSCNAGCPESWINVADTKFGIPLVIGMTAVSVSDYFPYLQSGQLKGLLTGLRGAAEYEKVVGAPPIANRRMWAQLYIHTFAILLIIIGNIEFFIINRSLQRS